MCITEELASHTFTASVLNKCPVNYTNDFSVIVPVSYDLFSHKQQFILYLCPVQVNFLCKTKVQCSEMNVCAIKMDDHQLC